MLRMPAMPVVPPISPQMPTFWALLCGPHYWSLRSVNIAPSSCTSLAFRESRLPREPRSLLEGQESLCLHRSPPSSAPQGSGLGASHLHTAGNRASAGQDILGDSRAAGLHHCPITSSVHHGLVDTSHFVYREKRSVQGWVGSVVSGVHRGLGMPPQIQECSFLPCTCALTTLTSFLLLLQSRPAHPASDARCKCLPAPTCPSSWPDF